MYTQPSLQADDTQKLIAIDNVLIEQIDERLGDAYLTRDSFIHAALQRYIEHIDEAARTQTIHRLEPLLGTS